MQKEQPGLLLQHMVMQCRDLDAIASQGLYDRRDLIRRKHEVSGDRRAACAG